MQKYYHKGAFYMDDESIREASDVRKREADAPTGEDKFNKEALPKVMQVRARREDPAAVRCWLDDGVLLT
jgi:microfibrillar-associated protein 1